MSEKKNGDPSIPSSEQGHEPPPDPAGEPPAEHVRESVLQFDSAGKPVVRWVQSRLHEVVDAAEEVLLHGSEYLFQRANLVVRVVHREAISVRNYHRGAGGLGVRTVSAPNLVETLTREAGWERWDAKKNTWIRIGAPDKVAYTYLARSTWNLPHLVNTLDAPTLRPDGSTLQVPGYDIVTRLYYEPNVEFPAIPEAPDRAQAETALALLRRWLATMPFATECDESVALSLVLTSLVRRSLPAAPLGAISAPAGASGTGKTLLADMISILSTGTPAPAMNLPPTDEEAAKTARAVLLSGDAVVLIDNIERPMSGEWLCTILTSEVFKQRMLGRSEEVSVPTNALFLATGNALIITGDLRTRTLLCKLDAKTERPETRTFSFDPRETTAHIRPQLVVAALTVMRAFIAACSVPDAYAELNPVPPWGRFEAWSRMVRAPLVWLGMMDPCSSANAIEDEDPQRNELRRFMIAWRETYAEDKKSAREALHDAENQLVAGATPTGLTQVISDLASDPGGKLSVKRMAGWLRVRAGSRAGGLELQKAGMSRDHVALWRVIQMA